MASERRSLRPVLFAILTSVGIAAVAQGAPPELPWGTWHVLIHYQRLDGPDPDRWLWDERVWVIEPSEDDPGPENTLEWTEHAILSLQDTTGRFENLGTNMARRLVGAWTPNAQQTREIETGVTVSSRGMRRKTLEARDGGWRSGGSSNAIGKSAAGVAYHEVWAIEASEAETRFEIDTRFELLGETESGGGATYVTERQDDGAWTGRYARAGERRGIFRMVPTRILVEDSEVAADPGRRPAPVAPGSIELVPDTRIHSDVPLLVSVLRPFHYYGERSITIDSSPPGAELDLAYLRRGTQLMYRRGRAPLEVELPTRLQADASDHVLVRGFVPGHERTRVSYAVATVPPRVEVMLPPLPNQIREVAHGHVAGRSVIELVSLEQPSLRVSEERGGYTVVLVRTGLRVEPARRLAAFRDPMLELNGQQLGDDFVLRLTTKGTAAIELRQEVRPDAARHEFRTRLLLSSGDEASRTERLRLALEDAHPAPPGRCVDAFESALREHLGESVLLASLGRDDHAERVVLRAALRRLAESTPDHALKLRAGRPLAAGTPLEFELAWTRRTEIDGYLDWLHEVATTLDSPGRTGLALRSWIAPTWEPDRFAALLDDAMLARADCKRAE
jgi:hypothetical protein